MENENSELTIPKTTIIPPTQPYIPRISPAKVTEKRAANTGSKLKRSAVWFALKIVWAQTINIIATNVASIYAPLESNLLLTEFLNWFDNFDIQPENIDDLPTATINDLIKAYSEIWGLLLITDDSVPVPKPKTEFSRKLNLLQPECNYKKGSVKQWIEFWKTITAIKYLWDYQNPHNKNRERAIILLNTCLEEIPIRVNDDGITGRNIPSLRACITFQLYEYMFGVTYTKICPYSKCYKPYMTESKKQNGCSTKHANNYRQEKRRDKRNS